MVSHFLPEFLLIVLSMFYDLGVSVLYVNKYDVLLQGEDVESFNKVMIMIFENSCLPSSPLPFFFMVLVNFHFLALL